MTIKSTENTAPQFAKSFMGKSVIGRSLSRVWKHLDFDKGFFIISAHLNGMAEAAEIKTATVLLVDIIAMKLGYIPLRGVYDYKNGETRYEHCFFVSNNGSPDFKQKALTLCKKYNQPSVLFAEKRKVYILYSDGKIEFIGDAEINNETLRTYWIRLKRLSQTECYFAFESLYPINSFGLNAAHNWGELL